MICLFNKNTFFYFLRFNIKIKPYKHKFSNRCFMTPDDFSSLSGLNYLIPLIYLASWVSMIMGPIYFPQMYNEYCMIMVMYLALRSVILCGLNVKLVINYHNTMKNVDNDEEKQLLLRQRKYMSIYHTFIIPSYNEDRELLAKKLSILSQHQRAAQSYMVFLAMEKHELNSQEKAISLKNSYKEKFLHIAYTLHDIQPTQHKGKASNVNYCARSMQKIFKELMIEESSVFLTIIDADSWAPQVYINQLQKHMFQNFEQRHKFIYQPPQIYTRNSLSVCSLIRTYDDMYSSMHASSLVSLSGISFSLSNYTLSYSLAKKIEFWDIVEGAIGEDMHMCLKAMFKTGGEVRTVPIYVPFNQLNIQTGNAIISNVKAKFWQIERHARGVADVGYCLSMLMKNKPTLKTFWTTLSIMQVFFIPIMTPWALISIFLKIIFSQTQSLQEKLSFSQENLFLMITIANIGTFVSNIIFEVFKRRSSKQIYKIQNPSLFRIFQGSILYTINLVFMTVPAFVVGAFGNLKTNRQFIVTEKNSNGLLKEEILRKNEIK